MKKSNNLVAALIIGATFSGASIAADNGRSVNQELSDQRVKISKQMLQNKLYQAQLDGLQKQQEIKTIQDSLNGESSTSSGPSIVESAVQEDHSFKFNESLNEEDILSEGNNWKQSVGFIYQDDLDIGSSSGGGMMGNSAISDLTDSSQDLDFEEMLKQVASEAKTEITGDEAVDAASGDLNSVNDFKLIGVELSKLNIYEDEKKASLKVSYITNNGYQKIRGSKIVSVVEGSTFNVKGKVSFKVLSINDNGIEFENLTSGKKEKATK